MKIIKTFLDWLNKPRYFEFGSFDKGSSNKNSGLKRIETSLDRLIAQSRALKLERKWFAEGLIVGGLIENHRQEGCTPEDSYQKAMNKLMEFHLHGDINEFGTFELIADEVA